MQEIKKWWKKVILNDVYEITSSKRIYFNEYTENWIPFYRSKEIIQKYNNQDINEILYISEDKFNEIKNKFWAPKEDDILLTAVWTLWIPYLVKKSDNFYFKDGNLIWFKNSKNEIINSKYFYFWIISDLWKECLKSITIWSSQSAYTIVWIKSLEILLPPLPTQQKIASILSKYDDLIENNNKRIKVLEKTAQSIYEEWFVKYNFPWSENIKMIDSWNDDFGMIPEGWKIINLIDISETQYWYAFKSKDFNEEWKWNKVIRIRNVKDWITKTYSDQAVDNKYLIENWDILVWMDWDFHIWKWVWWNAYLVQRSVCFRENIDSISKYFLLLSLTSKIQYLNSVIVWTTVAHLSAKDINNIKVILPTEDILEKSKEIFDNLYNLEIKLRLENQKLKETRDLLIPRLVSGELDIESLEIK